MASRRSCPSSCPSRSHGSWFPERRLAEEYGVGTSVFGKSLAQASGLGLAAPTRRGARRAGSLRWIAGSAAWVYTLLDRGAQARGPGSNMVRSGGGFARRAGARVAGRRGRGARGGRGQALGRPPPWRGPRRGSGRAGGRGVQCGLRRYWRRIWLVPELPLLSRALRRPALPDWKTISALPSLRPAEFLEVKR